MHLCVGGVWHVTEGPTRIQICAREERFAIVTESWSIIQIGEQPLEEKGFSSSYKVGLESKYANGEKGLSSSKKVGPEFEYANEEKGLSSSQKVRRESEAHKEKSLS